MNFAGCQRCHKYNSYCTLMHVVVILSSNCLCSIAPKFLSKLLRNREPTHSLSVTHFESWLGMETRLTDVVLEIAPQSRNKSGNIAKIGVESCDKK